MRSVDATLRRHLLDGLAGCSLSLLCQGSSLNVTASRLSLSVGGTPVSDDYWDGAGLPTILGESALAATGAVCLWNPAAANGTSAWYLSDLDGQHTLTGGDTGLSMGRPGLGQRVAGDFLAAWVNSAGALRIRPVTYTRGGVIDWSINPAYTVASLGTLDAAAVAVVDENTLQVAGYNGQCLWLQRFTYSGSWSAGAQQIVAVQPWGYALPHSLSAVGSVVTLHLGGGYGASLLYQNGIYSAPYPLLGTPPDQLVYPWGLSYQNGRYVLLVTTRVYGENSQYYAYHTRALSSPDGRHWRDEGALVPAFSGLRNPLQVRGKLLADAVSSYICTPTGYFTGDLPAWLSDTPTSSFTSVPFEAQGSLAGLRATHELAALVRPDERYLPGTKIQAVLQDGAASATLFTGYLDVAGREDALGASYTRLVARGPLGRLIGETAYRPVTLMDLPGRGAWHTSFYDAAAGLPVNALAAADGPWLAQNPPALASVSGGLAYIPQSYAGMQGYFRVRFKAADDFYLTCGNDTETDKAGQTTGTTWAVGLSGSNLVIGYWYHGTWLAKASTPATGYSRGTPAELVLILAPGRLEVILLPTAGAAHATWVRLAYSFLTSETLPFPARWTLACYTPRALNADGSYVARLTTIYEVTACDPGIPWSVGEAIGRVAERAGASLSNVTTTYVGNSGSAPYVSLINIHLATVSAGDLLFLKGRLDAGGNPVGSYCTFQSGYLVIDSVEYPYRGDRAGLKDLRVLWYDDLLALYQNDELLLCLYLHPVYASGYLWSTATFTMLDLYQPAEASAWDYNQPAESIMSRLLERRRAYLVETAAGGLRLSASPEGSETIGPANPFEGHQSYESAGASYDRQHNDDARGAAGLVGVIGQNDTVYVVDPLSPAYGLSSLTNDNPWAYGVEDGLKEAHLQILDNRRARESVVVAGVLDPALELTDIFTLPDGSQWLAASYDWGFVMQDKAALWDAHLVGNARVTEPAAGLWGTVQWAQGVWG